MSVRLFVGNLSYDATEEELKALFAAAGPVAHVHLPKDRETGRPRGFAFVEFLEKSQAEEAIRRFNNQDFKGRPMVVNEARAREAGTAPRPYTPRPYSPRPSSSRPDWSPAPAGEEEEGKPRGIRRTFGGAENGPHKKKRYDKGERVPKGPIRERHSGRLYDIEDAEDDVEWEGDDIARRADDEEE
jgi:RNA recognition motif-containing protein